MAGSGASSIAKGHRPYDYSDPNRKSLASMMIPGLKVVEALDKAGFPESEWVTGVAVARRESTFVPTLIGAVNPESWDFGLWQISYKWNSHLMQGPRKIGEWDDPLDNAKMAKYLFDESVRRGHEGWRPWHTYTSGNYREYIDLARDLVDEYKRSHNDGEGPKTPSSPANTEGALLGRMPGVDWRPISQNFRRGGNNPRLLIMHTIVGSLAGADSWFRNSSSRVSAHFGVGKDGRIIQWVDTNDVAWANASANSFSVSIENEGQTNEPLTAEQIESNAAIYAFVHSIHRVPLSYANSATGSGYGYHSQYPSWSLGGTACPGSVRVAQMQEIVRRTGEIVGGSVPNIPPPGASTPFPSGGMTSVRSIMDQQRAVNSMGHSPRLDEDGIWGPKTSEGVRWAQGQLKVSVDGLWGRDTEQAYLNRNTSGGGGDSGGKPVSGRKFPRLSEDGIYGTQTKKALQTYLGVAADGIVGPATTRALQRKVGATADGIWGANTTKALQRALNSGSF